MALTINPTMVEDKLESHAIIPPLLLEVIVKLDSFEAQYVLVACITKIRSLGGKNPVPDQHTEESQNTESTVNLDNWEEFTEDELANKREGDEEKRSSARIKDQQKKQVDDQNRQSDEPSGEDKAFDTDDRFFEQRYYRILLFLWSVVHDEAGVKPVHINPCSKVSTLEWLDSLHEKCLGPSLPPQPQAMPPHPFPMHTVPNLGLDSAAVAMTKLSDAWGKKIQMEVQEKEDREKKKKEKSFEKLSEVQQRTLTLITATERDSDDTVKSMKPTEEMMKVLEQTVGIKVQAQLQYEFKTKGHMVDIGLALATQLKNGCITSQPSVNDINGLSPFFLPHQAADERLNQDLALRLEELLSFGKINEADL